MAPMSDYAIAQAIESGAAQRFEEAIRDGETFAAEHLCLAAAKGAARIVGRCPSARVVHRGRMVFNARSRPPP